MADLFKCCCGRSACKYCFRFSSVRSSIEYFIHYVFTHVNYIMRCLWIVGMGCAHLCDPKPPDSWFISVWSLYSVTCIIVLNFIRRSSPSLVHLGREPFVGTFTEHIAADRFIHHCAIVLLPKIHCCGNSWWAAVVLESGDFLLDFRLPLFEFCIVHVIHGICFQFCFDSGAPIVTPKLKSPHLLHCYVLTAHSSKTIAFAVVAVSTTSSFRLLLMSARQWILLRAYYPIDWFLASHPEFCSSAPD